MRYITKDEEVKLIELLEEIEDQDGVWISSLNNDTIMIGADWNPINGFDKEKSGSFTKSLRYQLCPFFYKWSVERGGIPYYAIPLRSKLHKILNEKHKQLTKII